MTRADYAGDVLAVLIMAAGLLAALVLAHLLDAGVY